MEKMNRDTQMRPSEGKNPRKRRPKWQRVLRKYWPPIRLGLICLILLAVLIGGVRLVAGLFREGEKEEIIQQTDPVETDPTEDQIREETLMRIEDADLLAAGYDYEAAMELLRNDPYYAEAAEALKLISRIKKES